MTYELARDGNDIVVFFSEKVRVESMPGKRREQITDEEWEAMWKWAKPFFRETT